MYGSEATSVSKSKTREASVMIAAKVILMLKGPEDAINYFIYLLLSYHITPNAAKLESMFYCSTSQHAPYCINNASKVLYIPKTPAGLFSFYFQLKAQLCHAKQVGTHNHLVPT